MKELIITQSQYNTLMSEQISLLPARVQQIRKALDDNFMVDRDKNSPNYGSVYKLDATGRAIAIVDDIDVFYKIQSVCQNIADKATRDSLIRTIIKDWYKGSTPRSVVPYLK